MCAKRVLAFGDAGSISSQPCHCPNRSACRAATCCGAGSRSTGGCRRRPASVSAMGRCLHALSDEYLLCPVQRLLAQIPIELRWPSHSSPVTHALTFAVNPCYLLRPLNPLTSPQAPSLTMPAACRCRAACTSRPRVACTRAPCPRWTSYAPGGLRPSTLANKCDLSLAGSVHGLGGPCQRDNLRTRCTLPGTSAKRPAVCSQGHARRAAALAPWEALLHRPFEFSRLKAPLAYVGTPCSQRELALRRRLPAARLCRAPAAAAARRRGDTPGHMRHLPAARRRRGARLECPRNLGRARRRRGGRRGAGAALAAGVAAAGGTGVRPDSEELAAGRARRGGGRVLVGGAAAGGAL